MDALRGYLTQIPEQTGKTSFHLTKNSATHSWEKQSWRSDEALKGKPSRHTNSKIPQTENGLPNATLAAEAS